jgi:hypothetical protein
MGGHNFCWSGCSQVPMYLLINVTSPVFWLLIPGSFCSVGMRNLVLQVGGLDARVTTLIFKNSEIQRSENRMVQIWQKHLRKVVARGGQFYR